MRGIQIFSSFFKFIELFFKGNKTVLRKISLVVTFSFILWPSFLLLLSPFAIATTPALTGITPTKILSTAQNTYFNANSATTISTYGGAWVMAAKADKLYAGWSRNVPEFANTGTFLSYYDIDTGDWTKISNIDSQDIEKMKIYNTTLYIPNLDPLGGWDAGELITVDTDSLALTTLKYRYSSNHFIDATTTDSNGNYSFSGLKNNTVYILKIITPENYALTTQFARTKSGSGYAVYGDNLADSDYSTSSKTYTQCDNSNSGGSASFIKLNAAYEDDSIDAGLVSSPGTAAGSSTSGTVDSNYYAGDVTLGDRVWIDTNSNGYQDSGELGLSDVRIELYTKDPYFPCALHADGIYVDSDGTLYYDYGYLGFRDGTISTVNISPGLYLNFYTTDSSNVLFRSTDNGSTWTAVDTSLNFNSSTAVAKGYFAADITKSNGIFYRNSTIQGSPVNEGTSGTTTTYHYPYTWSHSTDGITWNGLEFNSSDVTFSRTSGANTLQYRPSLMQQYSRLLPFRNGVIVPSTSEDKINKIVGADRTEITAEITAFGDILSSYTNSLAGASGAIPDYITGSGQRYNSMAVTDDGQYLYAIGDDNKLYVTSNLRTWSEVTDFSSVDSGRQMIALEYWADQAKLVASTYGAAGSIYTIDHQDVVDQMTKITTTNTTMGYVDNYEPTLDYESTGSIGTNPVRVKDSNGTVLSVVDTTFSGGTLNWNNVHGEADTSAGKSYVSNLVKAPGTSATHTLYIPIPSGKNSNQAVICPYAASLSDVAPNCNGAVWFNEGETKTINGYSVTLLKTTVNGQSYWYASGATGTGGYSYPSDQTTSSSSCTNSVPVGNIELFEMRATDTSVKLFFTPLAQATKYNIYYQRIDNGGQYATSITAPTILGVVETQINYLQPTTEYKFTIEPLNDCAPGTKSNSLSITTRKTSAQAEQISYLYPPIQTTQSSNSTIIQNTNEYLKVVEKEQTSDEAIEIATKDKIQTEVNINTEKPNNQTLDIFIVRWLRRIEMFLKRIIDQICSTFVIRLKK